MVDYNSYAEDLQRYLASKLPNEDFHTICEITEYVANRTGRLMAEAVVDRDNEWKRLTRKLQFYRSQRTKNTNVGGGTDDAT